ncbi:MAG: hypothetical protein PHD02_02315 [Bacilli bacterium]|nr:hypothetical protein [Bacilli bacterium]
MNCELALLLSKKSGFLKRESSIVTFFKDEVLVTVITKSKQKELFKQKKEDIKNSGGGFIKQTFAMTNVLPEYMAKIKLMNKEDIKKENTTSILKSKIEKIKFTPASRSVDYDNGGSSQTQGKLILYVNKEKIKFTHPYEDNTKEIRTYINNYLNY